MRHQVKVSVYRTNRNIEKSIEKTCFASRRYERGLGANEKPLHGIVEIIVFTKEGKKEGAVDGALENPSGYTSTIWEELTYREAPKGKMWRYQFNNM